MIDRRAFYEQRAAFRARESGRYYQQLLRRHYAFLVPPGLRVLEVGCGIGDLLAAVKPARGAGGGFQPGDGRPGAAAASRVGVPGRRCRRVLRSEQFDYIILSDLVNDLPDVQAVFERLQGVAHPRTRLVLNFFNNLWRPALHAGEKLGLKSPTLLQNWLSSDDTKNLLHLAGWEVIKTDARILWPVRTPPLDWLLNRWLAPLMPPFCVTVMLDRAAQAPAGGAPAVSLLGGHSGPQRGRQHRGRRPPHARDGAGHGDHLYRGPFEGRHVGRDPARGRPVPAAQHQGAEAAEPGQGRRCARGLRRRHRRRAVHPGCRFDDAAGGVAQVLRDRPARAPPSSSTACGWCIRWKSKRCSS